MTIVYAVGRLCSCGLVERLRYWFSGSEPHDWRNNLFLLVIALCDLTVPYLFHCL